MDISETLYALKKLKKAAIISHIRPDGDTIGSACALKALLKELGIQSDIYCDDVIPEKFFFLEGTKEYLKDFKTEKYDGIIAVDCSDRARLGSFALPFEKHKETFNIDHHISNTKYAKYNLVEERAATCEIMFSLVEESGVTLSGELAEFIMLGICTDTGNFAHKNVTYKTFETAARLMSAGCDLNRINYHMFKRQSKSRAMLFGKAVSGMKFFSDERIALITINKEMLKACGATPDETEGFIDFPLSIDTVEVAVCLLQTADKAYKVSLRAKGANDVNKIAGVFGGGGHILASGCMLCGFYEDVVEKLIFQINNYLD